MAGRELPSWEAQGPRIEIPVIPWARARMFTPDEISRANNLIEKAWMMGHNRDHANLTDYLSRVSGEPTPEQVRSIKHLQSLVAWTPRNSLVRENNIHKHEF